MSMIDLIAGEGREGMERVAVMATLPVSHRLADRGKVAKLL